MNQIDDFTFDNLVTNNVRLAFSFDAGSDSTRILAGLRGNERVLDLIVAIFVDDAFALGDCFKDEMLLYYKIYIDSSDMVVMVPVNKADELGIRQIVSAKEAEEALNLLSEEFEPISDEP